MDFNTLKDVELYVFRERANAGGVNHYFFPEQKTSKEKFLQNYYNFLKEKDNIPLDILNSKIKTFDVIYISIVLVRAAMEAKVKVEIGKDRSIKHYAGSEWNEYSKKLEPVYEYEHVTDWHFVEYNVENTHYGAYCLNDKEGKFITSKYNTSSDLYKKLEEYTFTNDNPKDSGTVIMPDTNLSGTFKLFWDEAYSKLEQKANKKAYNMGDRYRDLQYSFTNKVSNENALISFILMPVGYIQYEYNSKTYFYIELLTGEKILFFKQQNRNAINILKI